MTNSVAVSDYAALLERAKGSPLRAFELLEAETRKAKEGKEVSVKKDDRIEAAKNVIESKDPGALAEVRKAFTDLIVMIKKAGEMDPASFTDADALALMKRWIAFDKADVFLQAQKSLIREKVFDVVAARAAADGAEDPENTDGRIPVPKLGLLFDKYGCGHKATQVDQDYLKSLVGDEVWEKVTTKNIVPRQVIEAHVEQTFSLDKYMELASQRPELLEPLQASLEMGPAKTPSFTVRRMNNK